jgi:lipopolysaccharide export system permease protein
MKKLNWYILKEHFGPFIFAFATITFLLLIDYVPRIVDHVIDKDLSIWVVLELIGLNLAWILALSVPMSVLVATLMAFGRLTSDFEITAIKACGVNLLRVLTPLLIGGAVIAVLMIEFNDKILPDLNKMQRQLSSDISRMRPTLTFKPGTFIDDIPGYLILLDDIDHTTSEVTGVHITEMKNPSAPRVIVAREGILRVLNEGENIQFSLDDGEIHTLNAAQPQDYQRVDFEHQVINIGVEGTRLERRESNLRTDREMGINAMQEKVDNARDAIMPFRYRINQRLTESIKHLFLDTMATRAVDTLPDSNAYRLTRQDAEVLERFIQQNANQIESQKTVINKYSLEIHKKYSIPAASLAFILIGAPLGVITRRGGMGTAIATSISLFIVYWAFLIGGEDLADRGIVSPFWAMWSANFLIGAIGVYLLYIVVTEKRILSFFRRSK